jgi:hypothetical protein
MKSVSIASLDTAATPSTRPDDWPVLRLPITAFSGLSLTAVGSAGSMAVMLGLIGIPVAAAGIAITALIAPTLVRPAFGKWRNAAARSAALVAGLASALSSLAFAASAAPILLAISRGRLPAQTTVLGTAMAAHWPLWLATIALGLLATWTARGRNMARDLDAVILWAAYAPTTVLVLQWLFHSGAIALSA